MNLLAVVLFTLTLSAQAQAQLTGLWANDGGDKVTRQELRQSRSPMPIRNAIWDGERIHLFGAQNEVVSFNLVLEAADQAVLGVEVALDLLEGPGGTAIASLPTKGDGVFDWTRRQIELFYVRYLPIKGLSLIFYNTYDERHVPKRLRRPHDEDGVARGTFADRPDQNAEYPEIAVPLELVGNFDIGKARNQSIFADIYIPKSTRPGVYRGRVSVHIGGQLHQQVPVVLEVLPFALPDEPTAKTMLHLGYSQINRRYLGKLWPNAGPEGDAAVLIQDRHFQLAHRHRLTLVDAGEGPTPWTEDSPRPSWRPRLDGSLFTPARGYDGPGVGVGNGLYSIGTYGSWGWKDEGEAGMKRHASAWAAWFATHAPQTETFLYLIDESGDLPQIERWSQWLKSTSLKGFATLPAPDAVASAPSLDVVASRITVGPRETWAQAAAKLKADSGKRFYAYNGWRPASGTFATEDDGVALRILPWIQYKHGIDRWFFWESTYYDNNQGGTGETNVFKQAMTFGGRSGVDPILGETGWNYGNGDGVLFYPGTDQVFPAESYGVRGPLASLRLKHWRRGLQDVEYLALAARRNPQAAAQVVREMVPRSLWEFGVTDPDDPTWVRTDLSWSTDPDHWENARRRLAKLIMAR